MTAWTLCSECFDETESEGILEIILQSTCGRCGRLCLGYVTETDTPSNADPSFHERCGTIHVYGNCPEDKHTTA